MADTNPTEQAAAPPPAEEQLTPGQKAVEAAAATEAAPEQPKLSAKAQKLVEAGFEGVANDDEAFDRLLSAYQQTKTEFGNQLQQALEELKQSAAQPTQQVQDAQDAPWWNPPQVDEGLIARYRTAEGWKPETPAEVRQQGDALQAYYDRWTNDLVRNAPRALGPAIREEAAKVVRELMGQTQQTQHLNQFQQKVFSENPWLFESDPITNKPKLNALSAEGQILDGYMREAQARGADYEFAWDYALTKHQAAKALAQSKNATQAKSATEQNAEQKRALLNRAAGTANRTGSLPQPNEERMSQRNRALRAGERFKQIAGREGLALQ